MYAKGLEQLLKVCQIFVCKLPGRQTKNMYIICLKILNTQKPSAPQEKNNGFS